jgi:hypothetical protein
MAVPPGIDRSAPVIALHEIDIEAALDAVWQLHVNVNAWPIWQTDITAAHIDGALEPGVAFDWTSLLGRRRAHRPRCIAGHSVHAHSREAVPGGTRVQGARTWINGRCSASRELPCPPTAPLSGSCSRPRSFSVCGTRPLRTTSLQSHARCRRARAQPLSCREASGCVARAYQPAD